MSNIKGTILVLVVRILYLFVCFLFYCIIFCKLSYIRHAQSNVYRNLLKRHEKLVTIIVDSLKKLLTTVTQKDKHQNILNI